MASPTITKYALWRLLHIRSFFVCDACGKLYESSSKVSSFRCENCRFDLDISCALSTLSDRGDSQKGATPEQINLLRHPHPLTSFSWKHDFVGDSDCMLCLECVEGDGYMCLRRRCEFLIHKSCIQDLYHADGTKAPQVYHDHQLGTFLREDTGSSRCAKCGSDASSKEFICCAWCKVFIHRDCIQVPETLQYLHHPHHTLVLFINCPDNHKTRCASCSSFLKGDFFVHIGCALRVLAYCEEGLSVEIESWHKHPLLLCHGIKSVSDYRFYCEDESAGPAYVCKVQDYEFLLHRRCIEIEPTIMQPQHREHRLTLRKEAGTPHCQACFGIISNLSFSCQLCTFYLHAKFATCVPTRKHYLHEHELLRLDKVPFLKCILCGANNDSPFFRCIPCNFNLHKKCMELPQVVKHDTHVH